MFFPPLHNLLAIILSLEDDLLWQSLGNFQDSCAEVELPPPVGVCRERECGNTALVTMGDDLEALCLVKVWRELERAFG